MNQNSTYVALSVSLIALSLSGAYIFLRPAKIAPVIVNQPIPTITQTDENITDVLPTSTITSTPTDILPTPSPVSTSFTSDADNFTISFSSNRKLYQDKESTGNRYTLYSSVGNIAIHVGKNWSWTYPDRVFTTDFQVASQPTFVYEVPTQTITDFQFSGKNYTIQCVHNGKSEIKSECLKLLSDFKFGR